MATDSELLDFLISKIEQAEHNRKAGQCTTAVATGVGFTGAACHGYSLAQPSLLPLLAGNAFLACFPFLMSMAMMYECLIVEQGREKIFYGSVGDYLDATDESYASEDLKTLLKNAVYRSGVDNPIELSLRDCLPMLEKYKEQLILAPPLNVPQVARMA